jgi:hypothetical protein
MGVWVGRRSVRVRAGLAGLVGVVGPGCGLGRGAGVPLIQTLSAAVDDETLLAALELLAPRMISPTPGPAPGPTSQQPAAAAAAAALALRGGEPRSCSEAGEGRGGVAPAARGGAGQGEEIVRSLSDVQLQGAPAPQGRPSK